MPASSQHKALQPGSTFNPQDYERPGLKQDEIEELKEAFDLFDTDSSGEICLAELKAAMKSLGYESKSETIFTMLSELDRDGNASLSFEEFLELLSGKQADDGQISQDEVDKLFRLIDVDNKNYISVQDVERMAKEVGENLSVEEITEVVRQATSDPDREDLCVSGKWRITREAFYIVMTKKTFP